MRAAAERTRPDHRNNVGSRKRQSTHKDPDAQLSCRAARFTESSPYRSCVPRGPGRLPVGLRFYPDALRLCLMLVGGATSTPVDAEL